MGKFFGQLVTTRIQGTDRQHLATEPLQRITVDPVLCLLVGQIATPENELGAHQADADGRAVATAIQFAALLGIAEQAEAHAIPGTIRLVEHPHQLAAVAPVHGLFFGIMRVQLLVPGCQQDAVVTIEQGRLTLAQQLQTPMHCHHHGNTERPGNDGRMRPDAAMLGDQPGNLALAQCGQFRRTERLGHDDALIEPMRHLVAEHVAGCLAKLPLEQTNHLVEVLHTHRQVFILHAAELAAQHGRLPVQRPLGVDSLAPNQPRSLPDQEVVPDHHPVRLDQFARRPRTLRSGQFALHSRQLTLTVNRRVGQPLDLRLDVAALDVQLGQLQFPTGVQVHLADRDSAGDAGAAQGKDHDSSPKRSSIRPRMAAIAASASGPLHSSSSSAPHGAASINTPMIDLALTRRCSRASQTSAWNSEARRTSRLAARACSPSLLTRRMRSIGIDSTDEDRLTRTGAESFGQFVTGQIGMAQRAQQHRQVETRQDPCLATAAANRGESDVVRRRAGQIGQHQRRTRRTGLADFMLDALACQVRIFKVPNFDDARLHRAIENQCCGTNQSRRHAAVGNQDQTGHRSSSR